MLGKVAWFSGDWVGFSLPNVMVIDEAKGKAKGLDGPRRGFATWCARGLCSRHEALRSARGTRLCSHLRGMTWDQMNKKNLQTTTKRCKKGEWEANVTAERIGVDTLEWWGIATRRSPPTAGPLVVKQARVEAASSAEKKQSRSERQA